MSPDDDPAPAGAPGSRPPRPAPRSGDEATAALPVPELAERIGPLTGDPDQGPEPGSALTVPGRRVLVHVAPDGIREIWAYPFRMSGPRIRDAGPGVLTRSASGAERRMGGEGSPVTERIVASRDSPVVWVEWSADGEPRLELEWHVAAYDPAPRTLAWRALGPRAWHATADGRSGSRALFILSREPDDLSVREDDDGHGLRVRARVRAPGQAGLRLAVVAARPGDDVTRLARVADRPGIAVRARMGAADRVRHEGLSVAAADPALGPALERDRIGLALGPVEPVGPWTAAGLAATGLDHLASGGFEAARVILGFLIRHVEDGGGLPPVRGLGPAVTDRAEPGDGAGWLTLLARYLAWTGDRATVGPWWPVVRGHGPSLGPAAGQWARVAEDMGDSDAASALRQREPEHDETGQDLASADSVIRQIVGGLLGAEPDAVRGRLVFRPRLTTMARLEVRGLAVGQAAVDVAWQHDGAGLHLEVRQGRGPAPLQLVLEPEVAGRAVARVMVDGRPAELDVERVGGSEDRDGAAERPGMGPARAGHEPRWRVPVQLVLDRPRTLDVEVDPG